MRSSLEDGYSLSAKARRIAKNLLGRAGLDLVRVSSPTHSLGRRLAILQRSGADCVFDIGANRGQYAEEILRGGFAGRVVSFEPIGDCYASLARLAGRSSRWISVEAAIGRTAGEGVIHVSGNTQSSSLLPMMEAHLKAAPKSRYVREEKVRIVSLAEALSAYARPSERVFVKADTQGYELEVIAGAQGVLDQVVGWELELSLVPLYSGQALIEELIGRLRDLGYYPCWMEPNDWASGSGALLQLDGMFLRSGAAAAGAPPL